MNKFEEIFRDEGVAYTAANKMDLVDLARKGVSKQSILRMAKMSSIPVKELAKLLPVSHRQFQRYDESERLKKDVSEHAILIAEVLLKGREVFENSDALKDWLKTPLLGLRQERPIDLLDTSFGIQLVIDELGRLEHGVYS